MIIFGLSKPRIYPSAYLEMEELQLIKASRKTAHDKVFLFSGKKAIFLKK